MSKWKAGFFILLALICVAANGNFQKFIFEPVNNVAIDRVSCSTTTATAICASRPTRVDCDMEVDTSTNVYVSTSAITAAGLASAKYWMLENDERAPEALRKYTGILYVLSGGTGAVTIQFSESYR